MIGVSRGRISSSGGRGESYGRETKRVNFDTESGDVLLLELSSQVTLDESGLLCGYPVSFELLFRSERMETMRKSTDKARSRRRDGRTLPVPPSPTRTSLKVGTSAIVVMSI